MTTHIVDTDLCVDYLQHKEEATRLLRPLIDRGDLAITSIVYAELREGVLGSIDPVASATGLDSLLRGVDLLDLDRLAADIFARIRLSLRRRGQPIADHDLWIAATALHHELTLLARDRHFDRIPELKRG